MGREKEGREWQNKEKKRNETKQKGRERERERRDGMGSKKITREKKSKVWIKHYIHVVTNALILI